MTSTSIKGAAACGGLGLYRVTLQFRRDVYVAAPSIESARQFLTSPVVRASSAAVKITKVQTLDPSSLSAIELNHPVYSPEGEELGTALEYSIVSRETPRRRQSWLNCPVCDEQLFQLRGFHLDGERSICNVCGAVVALMVEGRDAETHSSSLKFVEVVNIGQPQCDGSCSRAEPHHLCSWTCNRASETLIAWDWQRLSRKAQRAIDGFLKEPVDLEKEEIETLVEQALAVFGRGAERAWSRNWYRQRARTIVAWRASALRSP